MKKMKKLFAVILSLAMILGMSITSFADEKATSITISGITKEGDTNNIEVLAYKIINYDPVGKYVPVVKNSIDVDENGQLKPTGKNIQALFYEHLDELGVPVEITEYTENNGEYTYTFAPQEAGSWMIVVNGATKYVYNPAIVSVSQTPEGLDYGTLNLAKDSFTDGVYLKKSPIPFEKTTVTPDVKGVQYGDIIEFNVKTTIPSYPSSQTNLVFKISDTMTGLKLVVDEKHIPSIAFSGDVTEDDQAFADDKLSTIQNGGTEFTVDLSDDAFLHANRGKEITLTYWGKVTSDAKLTVDELNNTAKLDYSTHDDTASDSDETWHYTFGIDSTITGNTENWSASGEFFKVDEKGNVQYVEGEKKFETTEGETLEGAEFQLHIESPEGKLFTDATGNNTFTTTGDGRLEINGLDSDVTYYLVETKAPTGYTINSTPVKVKIDAVYTENGRLESYVVKMDDKEVAGYTFDAGTKVGEGKVTVNEEVLNPFNFKNTKLANLPSTGGIGTTIFTIGGCAIMIIAAGLFFASRRKAAK
jgi:Predicted outer membrane protein